MAPRGNSFDYTTNRHEITVYYSMNKCSIKLSRYPYSAPYIGRIYFVYIWTHKLGFYDVVFFTFYTSSKTASLLSTQPISQTNKPLYYILSSEIQVNID